MYEIDNYIIDSRVYRLTLPITQSNYIIPNFFEEQGQLKNKTITGLHIDIGPPRAGTQFNLSDNFSNPGLNTINSADSLSYMYLTLYNENEEIIFDQAPLNLFTNYNSQYPQPGLSIIGGKKRIIPMNTKINIRQSFVKSTPGFTAFDSVISFNFYYK
jgi:hypothetical protein